jgi:hypothetical protein
MPSGQNYNLQLEKSRELLKCIEVFNTEMLQIINSYHNKLSALESQGVPAEVIAIFRKDFFAESNELIKKNNALINDQAIPFVVNNIKFLEQFEISKPKGLERTLAGSAAAATALLAPFHPFSSTAQGEKYSPPNETTAIYKATEYAPLTLNKINEQVEQQGFTLKNLGDLAENVQNVAEAIIDGKKLKDEAE